MKLKYIYLVVLSILFSSCDDYLDITPKGKIIPKAIEDYELMLYKDQGFSTFSHDLTYGTDEFAISDKNYEITGMKQRNCYAWNSEIYDPNTISNTSWTTLYRNIYRCNIIIDGLPEVEGESSKRIILEAEAKSKRAIYYFYLVNIYGKHYNENSSSSDKGVPLLDDSDLEKSNLTRASVKEVYDLIIKDLEFAIKELPESSVNKFRMNKLSAQAMLARVYFYMGKYDECIALTDVLLTANKNLIDFNAMEYKNYGSKWGIYTQNTPSVDTNPEAFFICLYQYMTWGRSRIYASTNLYDLFPTDKSDLRGFYQFNLSSRDGLLYYRNALKKINLAVTVPELLLCRAEAYARQGDVGKQKAIDDLNYLRKNRIKTDNYVDLQASDYSNEDLLKFVLVERRREMCFKGQRWFDLKRLNLEPSLAITLKRTIKEEEHILEPNSSKYVYPIPFDVISFNPNMEQNKR